MRILAIDPGYDRVGVAVVEKTAAGKDRVVFSTCLTPDKKKTVAERIWLNCQNLATIIKDQSPTTLAIETLFFNKNVKTASAVSEARGAYRVVAQQANLEIVELSPQEIKVAMTGYGKSDKAAIHYMVNLLVEAAPKNAIDDEYDAIAIGVTCLAHYAKDSKIPKR